MPRLGGTTEKCQARQMAIRVAAGHIKKLGLIPSSHSAKMALRTLDDLAMSEPDLQVSRWYLTSSDSQIALFIRDWGEWCKYQRRLEKSQANTACTPTGGAASASDRL